MIKLPNYCIVKCFVNVDLIVFRSTIKKVLKKKYLLLLEYFKTLSVLENVVFFWFCNVIIDFKYRLFSRKNVCKN